MKEREIGWQQFCAINYGNPTVKIDYYPNSSRQYYMYIFPLINTNMLVSLDHYTMIGFIVNVPYNTFLSNIL